MKRKINGYTVETVGGFITIKYWAVYKNNAFIGIYFQFSQAKQACLDENFKEAYIAKLYS